jgi:two-component system LytT family response regulator
VSETLRVVIVDDEPLAREGLRIRLGAAGGVEVIAECASARAAIEELSQRTADVVFMDIQMPELDGFGVLAHLDRRPLPAVIFVTAHADQAIKAFRAGAIDYLVKPYDDETLLASVERARGYVRMAKAADRTARPALTRISVKTRGQVLFIPVDQIDSIESSGDFVRVHTPAGSHEYNATMRDMEAMLDPASFARIHRTAIVALRAIVALEPYSSGEHLVVLRDGRKLPLSRRAKPQLAEALEALGSAIRRR